MLTTTRQHQWFQTCGTLSPLALLLSHLIHEPFRVQVFRYFIIRSGGWGGGCSEIAGHRQEFPNIAGKEAWVALPRQPHTSHPSHVHTIYTQRGVAGIFECGPEKQELQLFLNVCARVWAHTFVCASLTHSGVQLRLWGPLGFIINWQGERNICVCLCFPAVSM